MCGIAGIWSLEQQEPSGLQTAVDGMLGCLAHRGPDDHGVWTSASRDVFLGHRRLSILDLSALGHQPMGAGAGRYQIVFNGEIYNYPELRRELEDRGESFASDSDTEVLLRGYMVWGAAVLERLAGMFAFAIWDGQREELFVARDRAGEKPLYYASTPRSFAFASELRPLAWSGQVERVVDPESLALYLTYQYIPAPRTIFRGVHKLPPGHMLHVSRGGMRVTRYWDPVAIGLRPRLRIEEPEAINELETLLRGAVRGQMLADVPLGAFLSGGIDSTAVVSMMAEVNSAAVKTFTIGFETARFNEAESAAAVAQHIGTDHTVEYLTDADALRLIPQIPAMYGEPFADASALPTHLVSQVARRHVTVALSGDGADEAFGGYDRYAQLESLLGYALPGVGPVARLVSAALPRLPHRVHRAAALLGRPPREVYRALVTFFEPQDVTRMTGLTPASPEFDRAWGEPGAVSARQRAMLSDMVTYLPEAILVKVDRAAMMTSLETRAPFLDHRLLEFALGLPHEMVRDKRVLKALLYRRVPRALLDRPKQGFAVPLVDWWRGPLRETLLDVVTPDRMRATGIQDTAVVTRILSEHLSGRRNHANRLWALYVLGLWAERSTAW